ncbi:IclR family transcriptional regulator [Alteromonas sp. S015]|uniref:IclR family transcriptional regulator n=1 Tax=Alteromonas sp. S015 TaxID=3117401 RepID=UPI002FE1FDCF
MATERYTIPSVVHACEILRLMANSEQGLSMQALEEALSLPRTTVFRLLKTLLAENLLEKRGKLYFSGASLLQLGLQVIHSDRLQHFAIPHIQRLALQTGYTAHLAVPNHGKALIVEVFDSPSPLMVSKRPGGEAQLHCSATGKVFLAFLYADNIELLMEEHPMEKHTDLTITEIDVLEKELSRVRAMGYAVDEREYNKDIRCVAVPVRDSMGTVVAALGITAPAAVFPKGNIQQVSDLVKEAARGIYKDTYQLDRAK